MLKIAIFIENSQFLQKNKDFLKRVLYQKKENFKLHSVSKIQQNRSSYP